MHLCTRNDQIQIVCVLSVIIICFLSTICHATNPSFEKGKKAFDAFQFEKAIIAFTRSLTAQPALSKQEQAKTHSFLALAQYNQAKPKLAESHYLNALNLDPNTKLPPDMAPPMKAFFQKIYTQWKAKQTPTVHRRAVAITKRPVERRNGNINLPATRKVVGAIEPSPSFFAQHKTSIIIGAFGVAMLLGGVGAGIYSRGKTKEYKEQQEIIKTGDIEKLNSLKITGKLVENTNKAARNSGIASIVLLVGGGLMTATSIGIFFFERSRNSKKTALLQHHPISQTFAVVE